MSDIIYFGLPSHHYFSIEQNETFNSFLQKRMECNFDHVDEFDCMIEKKELYLFSDKETSCRNKP